LSNAVGNVVAQSREIWGKDNKIHNPALVSREARRVGDLVATLPVRNL